jgi:hypothetical protein
VRLPCRRSPPGLASHRADSYPSRGYEQQEEPSQPSILGDDRVSKG